MMAFYDFKCNYCGHCWELSAWAEHPECPNCNSNDTLQDYTHKRPGYFVRGSNFASQMCEIEATGKCKDPVFYRKNKEQINNIQGDK